MPGDTLRVEICFDCYLKARDEDEPLKNLVSAVGGDEMRLRCPHYEEDDDAD